MSYVKFEQITGVGKGLFALDADGRVWKYVPSKTIKAKKPNEEDQVRYSFWVKVTDYRKMQKS